MLRKICLICAAVVIAWATILVLMWLGFNVDKTLLAMLMGMSVGALATKYNFGLVWKSAVVLLGGSAVWTLLNDKTVYAIVLFAGLALLTVLFQRRLNSKKGEPQSDRFKDCC